MQLQAVESSVCIVSSATEKRAKEILVVLRSINIGTLDDARAKSRIWPHH